MKLLYDQNLSPKLVQRLADLFPDSCHVRAPACGAQFRSPLRSSAAAEGEPLTRDEALRLFEAVAAKRDEIPFHILAEGCECRAQMMIEHMRAMGIEAGRAWALAVDRALAFPNPANPRQSFRWHNHVAPTLTVEGVEYGVLVIDPSTQAGPVRLREWAASIAARTIEVSDRGLSQAEILGRQAARALRGEGLDAIVFNLKLGEPPVPERGGSGFRIGPDPADGPSAFARAEMRRLLGR